ncbi:serine-rich adhesin for platelets isoform X2 [Armigeres subalbatus]|uniref:serine-rich adhesin for platelets isoform X2 n=1 Tax=Armigeres subalbatus TaxID=124917 RepID=UPI002ED26041
MKEMVGGCCVCSDDRGWSENPLVYCDGQSCAVAVHQACYGIVTVPSGPWYCRKCESQERSARVRCELCPSRDGALKRTDNLGWAHVVCALYIPEVRFGNVTTMEPIILQLIPQERYNKTCYICQEMGKGSRSTAGACMQCNKSGCKQQFHVTCAQQLGLLCEEAGNYLDNVKYCGYCQHHYSKLKKGGNVKTIPPYKPISHETNSSDGPSSPEKELDPAPTQPHPGGSNMSVSGNSGMKSNNRIPEPPGSTSSATSSSSKQRKSSSASKSSGNAISTSASSTSSIVSSVSGNINMVSQSGNPVGTAGISSVTSGTPSNSILGGVPTGKTSSSSSSSSSNKDKDKYSKNVNKVSSTNKSHDKEPSSSTSSSSSSQRDKSSKSSKSSGVIGSTGSSSSTPGLVSSVSNTTGSSSILAGSLPKDLDFATLAAANASAPPMPSSLVKQQDIATSRPEKTLAQISSAAATTARTASLSPADIPTTLIIKPPHDHTGNNKDLLSKEAIAKFTTSNFTETIVVNSDSVFGNTNTASNNPGIGAATVGASGAAPANVPSNTGSTVGPTSVIETGMGNPVNKLNAAGGVSSFPSTGSSIAKKRKADARSTPTSLSNLDIDINRDLIKDVAVSLVPLPLNKSDNIDPAALSGIEKNIKKAKTEPSSPHNPTGDPNIQNVSPNLIQSHTSNIVSSAIKHQQQPNSPQLQQHQQSPQQQQQQQGQQHTPSLVVSVPLSTATVPGVNLPANNSGGGGGGSSSASSTSASNNAPNSSSGNTSTIVSPGQMPSGSSLYQQLTQRTSDQIMNVAANRASPVIQQQSSSASSSHVIQNPAHSILERQSPSMRLSPAIISSAGSQHLLGPQTQHTFSGGGLELIASSTISSNVSVLQSVSPVPMSAIQSTSSSPIIPGGGDGGLKISFEKQVSVSRITALQEEDLTGRRSRSQSRDRGSGTGNGGSAGGGKTRTSKKRSMQQQQQRSPPSTATGSSTNSASNTANSAKYANESATNSTTNPSSTPSNSYNSSLPNANNNNQLNLTSNSSASNASHTNSANGISSNSFLPTSIIGSAIQPHAEKLSQNTLSASSSKSTASNSSSITTPIITSAVSGTHVIETVGMVSASNFQSNHPTTGGQSLPHLATGGGIGTGNSNHLGNSNSSSITAGTSTDHGHGTPSSNNTSSNSNSNNAVVVTHASKKLRSSQPSAETPSPSTSRTPDNSFGSSSSFSTGGLKFSYEAQPGTNPTTIGATSTIITPQPMVKESPPSSPGSDSGMARGSKRNRKLSTNSNAALGAPDAKESKLFQNGVVHATHMLGNQLNPNSSVAQKMSDQLSMELEAHSFVEAAPQIVGPPFPGKSQAARSNASAPVTSGPSLSSMLAGGGTATANGNTPQSLEQLLERQWEQGSQFLMEQAQHFDIASLLSCLHQLRSENIRLEEHVNNLVARRDHLLAVNARLAIPLNPTAMGGIGIVGGGGSGSSGGGGAGPGSAGGPGSTGGSGLGATGSQGQFNNMHGNGPHDSAGSNLSNPSVTSRSSRIQQHQSQQQQSQSLFSSNTSNQIPLENGIDFRHSNSSHQNTSSSSIRHHSPSNQSCPPPSNSSSRQPSSSSSSAISSEQPAQHSRSNRGVNSSSANNSLSAAGASGGNNPPSSSAYQAQQQTIYNTAHQIPLLLEHHQQEHHSQQQLQSQAQPQPAHHLRQTPPTVSSRSHQSHSARAAGGNPSSSSHSHHPGPLSHHHQALSSAPSSHAQPPPSQQQPLPQRQRH